MAVSFKLLNTCGKVIGIGFGIVFGAGIGTALDKGNKQE